MTSGSHSVKCDVMCAISHGPSLLRHEIGWSHGRAIRHRQTSDDGDVFDGVRIVDEDVEL